MMLRDEGVVCARGIAQGAEIAERLARRDSERVRSLSTFPADSAFSL